MASFERPNPPDRLAPRVLAADDHGPFLDVMRQIVEATAGFVIAAQVDSGEQAVQTTSQLRPDVVLMDVDMPGLGGIEASRQIKASFPETIVVLVSATHPDDLPAAAVSSGADRIVWKPLLRPALLEELWEAHRAPDVET
jgi:CheY-like chemotaxis protein